MRRAIALLLAILMGLSLCACSSGSNESTESTNATEPGADILGQWVSVMDDTYSLTFRSDGTCFYTGTPPTVNTDGSFTVVWEGLKTETTDPETKVTTYKYTYDPNVAIVTIYSTISINYAAVTEDGGEVTLSSVNGDPAYVREENYEEYHAAYLAREEAKRQANIEKFFADGKEGRTELVFGTPYAITEQLTLTAKEFIRGETPDEDGKYPLFLRVTLANVTDEAVTVRSGRDGNLIKNSKLQFGVNAHGFGLGVSVSHIGNDYILTGTEDDYSQISFDEPALVLNANAQKDYYLSIPRSKVPYVDGATKYYEPFYVVLTFDKIELFCNTTELEKNATAATKPEDAPSEEPTTAPTEAPTTPDQCSHSYTNATCTAPQTCKLCGATKGNAFGHTFASATCTTPQTCAFCGTTKGNASGHSFKDATCAAPKTCAKCGATEGGTAAHNYQKGNCTVCMKADSSITDDFHRILSYLREVYNKKEVTASDVAATLGLDVDTVNEIFTYRIQRRGLGVRTPGEIQLSDGTYQQVKFLDLTPAGMAYDPDA